jgi:putative DNA primase/helicase
MVAVEQLLATHKIKIPSTAEGDYPTTCPECSHKRKPAHQKLKCLGVKIDAKGVTWHCNHCDWSGPPKGKANGHDRTDLVTHEYSGPSGERLRKVRNSPGRQPKFWWQHWNGHGWVKGTNGAKPVLFRYDEVQEHIALGNRIAVVEGESDANALWAIGIPATTSPDGAAEPGKEPKWKSRYSEMLRGADVILTGDDDATGRSHIEATASSLAGVAEIVRVIDPKCWRVRPDAKDVRDWLNAGHTREELDRMMEQARDFRPPTSSSPTTRAGNAPSLDSAPALTYVMRAVRWFWNNRFALGKLGLICGLPDLGKGLITASMIAKATTAGVWPCNEGRAILGNVLLLTAEDDVEDTIIPRLIAAGADLARVHIIKMVKPADDGARRMFSLVTDLQLLRQKIDQIGDVVLVVIDPLSAYLGVGKVDSYRTTDVRGVLSPLTDLAAEKRVAVVGIMHFNKKADVHNAMLRVSDSLAYVATARHCYVVIHDHENKRRLFIKAKNNLAPDMAALSYTVDTITVGHDPDTKAPISAPYVVWGSEHVTITATEAMQAEETGTKSARPRDAAKTFLQEMLWNGPVKAAEIEEAAKANLISKATLKRPSPTSRSSPKRSAPKDGHRSCRRRPGTPHSQTTTKAKPPTGCKRRPLQSTRLQPKGLISTLKGLTFRRRRSRVRDLSPFNKIMVFFYVK